MMFKGRVMGVMCALNKGIEQHSVFSSSVQSVRTVINMAYEEYVDPWVGRMVQGKQCQGTGGRGRKDRYFFSVTSNSNTQAKTCENVKN
jgi:hypothetical protein